MHTNIFSGNTTRGIEIARGFVSLKQLYHFLFFKLLKH